MNTQKAEMGEGNALRNDPNRNYAMYSSERETVQEREYERLYLKASAQRDELLAAAKNAAEKWECSMGNECAVAFTDLKTAIAKAEGRAQ